MGRYNEPVVARVKASTTTTVAKKSPNRLDFLAVKPSNFISPECLWQKNISTPNDAKSTKTIPPGTILHHVEVEEVGQGVTTCIDISAIVRTLFLEHNSLGLRPLQI